MTPPTITKAQIDELEKKARAALSPPSPAAVDFVKRDYIAAAGPHFILELVATLRRLQGVVDAVAERGDASACCEMCGAARYKDEQHAADCPFTLAVAERSR